MRRISLFRVVFLILIFSLTACGRGYTFPEERLKRFTFNWYEDNRPSDELFAQAEQGDLTAQYLVGVYEKSQGSSREAMRFLRNAGEGGNPDAYYHLGMLYFEGYEIPGVSGLGGALLRLYWMLSSDNLPSDPDNLYVSYSKAFEFLQRAAEFGHAEAQNTIGYMLYSGRGVGRDEEKGCKWLRSAHLQNYSTATMNYAQCITNYEDKISLLELAAESHVLAAFDLGLAYLDMEELQQTYLNLIERQEDFSPETDFSERADKEGINLQTDYHSFANDWLVYAAERGSGNAAFVLEEIR